MKLTPAERQAEQRRRIREAVTLTPPADAEDVHAESMREQVLARAARSRPQPKPRKPGRFPKYLAFVREQPCMNCGEYGGAVTGQKSNAHHHAPEGHRAIGERCDDRFAVPLCCTGLNGDGVLEEGCHEHFHRTGHLRGYREREDTNAAIAREQGRLLVLAVTRGIL